MKWKIYYSDKKISSYDMVPEGLPGTDVQCIVQIDEMHGWSMVSGHDYYVFDDRGEGPRWWGLDWFGLFEYIFLHPGKKVALAGRFIEDTDFDRLHKEAMSDPDFKKKTGYRANERKPTQELD